MSRSNIKTGWWKVSFEITLADEDAEGKRQIQEVQFDDLSECTQEHILAAILDGCRQGEIVEEAQDD
jgi:hypothetical protein